METPKPQATENADAPCRPAAAGSTAAPQDGEARGGVVLPAVEELRERFESGALGWEETLKALQKLPKPWATKEWKAWRAENVGTACVQCGSAEGPMVLQHLRHPMSFNEIRKAVRHHLWEIAQENGHVSEPPCPTEERQVCPLCNSTAIRYYKTFGHWRCLGKKHGKQCGHEFSEPVVAQVPDKKAWWPLKQEAWREFMDWNEDLIGEQTLAISFEQQAEYLSMEHTTTFCKKCAFLWDQKGLRLCKCGRQYHAFHNPACRQCFEEGRTENVATS